MEFTGVYWVSVYEVLEERGREPHAVTSAHGAIPDTAARQTAARRQAVRVLRPHNLGGDRRQHFAARLPRGGGEPGSTLCAPSDAVPFGANHSGGAGHMRRMGAAKRCGTALLRRHADQSPLPVQLDKSRTTPDHGYRFTELLHGLHCDFTWVTHTASRQWFGAGRGQGEKIRSGEPPRCRPLSLFGKTMTCANCDCGTVGLRSPTPRALFEARLKSSSAPQ